MPMNIYMSQAIGNEPLAGVFSAVVVLLGMKTVRVPGADSPWHFRCLGLFLGLAMLTSGGLVLRASMK